MFVGVVTVYVCVCIVPYVTCIEMQMYSQHVAV